jgi:hypothetical protein
MLTESNRSKTPALGCYQGADSFGLFNLSELLEVTGSDLVQGIEGDVVMM